VVFEDSRPLRSGDSTDIARIMSQLLWQFAEELAAAIPKQPRISDGTAGKQTIEIQTTRP
jgi:hypothetical protein